jgi:hypothetical protein
MPFQSDVASGGGGCPGWRNSRCQQRARKENPDEGFVVDDNIRWALDFNPSKSRFSIYDTPNRIQARLCQEAAHVWRCVIELTRDCWLFRSRSQLALMRSQALLGHIGEILWLRHTRHLTLSLRTC